MQTETCEINPWVFSFFFKCERLLKLQNIQPLIIKDALSDKAADPFPTPPLASCCREVNVVKSLQILQWRMT